MASRVRSILAARRIPRKTLAPILGMTPSGTSRLVNGRTTWMAPEIVVVARFLGVSIDDLFPPQTWLEDRT
ncbi:MULTISPECIES: helix-turn-helix domain-containing protein [unclassified Microbacterium]|uniref:helix-turn-helix domain-containing protein n=1 Tax=unclassified Microbacterium TaxID=2609290 RepID=UPI00301ACF63